MTTVRCYVPLTPDQLARLRADRTLPGPLGGYAVTDALRADLPGGDADVWEHAALQHAARALVDAGAPVLIAAVDLTEERVDRTPTGGAGVGVGDVDLPRVAALHLGDDVVTGEPSAVESQGEDVELSWYDTTEIAHVAELVEALRPTGQDENAPES
ncbi:DUF6912 family protein [Ornithinimicrobium sp. LYQ103]|uniref:DUF6912 family protein n=1 Tax=Ornithinimicrobium sp. LYQ103 TaxID=3378796 RepID=UPI0038553253